MMMSTDTATRIEMHTVAAWRIGGARPLAFRARTLADAYRMAAEGGAVIPAADALAAEHVDAARQAAEAARAAEAEAYARPAERYGTEGNRAVCLARATEHRRAAEALAEAVAEAVTPARWAAELTPAAYRSAHAVDIADARAAYSLAVARERYAYAAEHTARARLAHRVGSLSARLAEVTRRQASEAVAVALAAVRTAEAPTLHYPVTTPAAALGVAVSDVVRRSVHGRPEARAAAWRVAAEAAADYAEAAAVDAVAALAADAAAYAARAAEAAELTERFRRDGWNGRPARAAEAAAAARIDAERAAEAAERAGRVLGAR